ncbi:MAG: hypothetical protein V1714_00145 [Pseudomonadota bacterium]
MKLKLFAITSAVFAVCFFSGIAPATVRAEIQLKTLGKSPFYPVKNLKAEAIYPILKKYEKDVQGGFTKAGSGNLYKPFMKNLETAKMEEIKIQPGDTFLWMIFKKKNKPFVLKNVKWAGKAPFKAYRMELLHEGKRYEFIFPNICLNIALKEISAAPVAAAPVPAAAPAPTPVPAAPSAAVTGKAAPSAAPPSAAGQPGAPAGTPAAVPSGAAPSGVPSGAAPSGAVPVVVPSGAAPSGVPSGAAPSGVPSGAAPAGAPTTTPTGAPPAVAAPAAAPVKAAGIPRKGLFVGDVGFMKQLDPATFLPIRVGYMHKFTDKTALTGLVGFAPLLEGCEDNPPKLADVLFSYNPVPKFFLGAGIGMWHTSFDTRVDLILEAGLHLTNNPTGPNFVFFLEGRSAFDEFDEISDLGRFGSGLRILF